MTKRDHSAAARKAWRTRKQMKKARSELVMDHKAFLQYRDRELSIKRDQYMQRILPCPDYSSK